MASSAHNPASFPFYGSSPPRHFRVTEPVHFLDNLPCLPPFETSQCPPPPPTLLRTHVGSHHSRHILCLCYLPRSLNSRFGNLFTNMNRSYARANSDIMALDRATFRLTRLTTLSPGTAINLDKAASFTAITTQLSYYWAPLFITLDQTADCSTSRTVTLPSSVDSVCWTETSGMSGSSSTSLCHKDRGGDDGAESAARKG